MWRNMGDVDFDHAVVGAGIVGSWTALHMVRLGKKVLLLEQFPVPHTRGSSHGQSRIIRSCYARNCFAQLMPYALRMWREAEKESGQKLMETTGLLYIARTEEDLVTYKKSIKNMKKFCPDELDEDETRVQKLLSGPLRYEELKATLIDKSGGVLFAHKCVTSIQNLFKSEGGRFEDNRTVQRIEHLGEDLVRLHLDGQREITVKSVVVCAGAWTGPLLAPFVKMPLQPEVVRVYYWKEKQEGAYSAQSGFPTLLDPGHPDIYALPSLEYPGMVKVCLHGGVPCDPDERDKTPQDPAKEEAVRQYVREHFPLAEDEPAIVETCMYTTTPDELFIVDCAPEQKNIVIGTGFSGTGFKTAPTIGRLLSEMATGTQPFLHIYNFRAKRFDQQS